jgi:hypothetical protein
MTMPVSKPSTIGCWEDERFIGVIVFALGASPSLGSPYGLSMWECCELVRVALSSHHSFVTRMIKASIKLIKERNPGLRLIVSFADPFHDHRGGIYQAGNWIYCGDTSSAKMVKDNTGKLTDPRRYNGHGWNKVKSLPHGSEIINVPGKHRYLYPLDKGMRRQILPLAQPYPKRGQGVNGDTPTVQVGEAGSIPAVRSDMTGQEPELIAEE